MRKGKSNKKELCQKSKKINIIVKGSDKVLRSKNFYTFEDNNEAEGGEEMTGRETYELLVWLKKEGYSLDDIIELIEKIANIKPDDKKE